MRTALQTETPDLVELLYKLSPGIDACVLPRTDQLVEPLMARDFTNVVVLSSNSRCEASLIRLQLTSMEQLR